MVIAAGAQQRDVLARRSAGGKAGAGLDEVRARVGDDAAEAALLVVGEQAALDDDLEDVALAGAAHGGDILGDGVPVAVLDHGEVYDHVYLIRALGNGVGGLEGLGGGGHVAVREADDRADRHAAGEVFLRARNVAGGNADRGAAVFHGLVTEGAYFFAPGVGAQQGMVAAGKYF